MSFHWVVYPLKNSNTAYLKILSIQFIDQSSSILSSTTCSGSTGCGTSQESSSEGDEPPAKVQCIKATCTDDRGDAVSGRGSRGRRSRGRGLRGRGSRGRGSRGRGSRGRGSRGRGGRPCDTVSTTSHLQTEDQSVPRYVCNVFT